MEEKASQQWLTHSRVSAVVFPTSAGIRPEIMLSFKSLRIAAEWRVRRGRAQRWRVRRKERGGVEKRARMERGEWAVSWRERHRSSGERTGF